MNEKGQARIPVWVAGLLVVGIIISVASGDAKITTSDGCQEWLNEIALREIREGFNPPDEANFYGLGVGVCFLGQTDA